jgi:DHA1 family bicyclomycin/chloramphenicol resistance-like MFS transporter
MGGLFSVFSAMPRVLIETMDFSPIQLGLVFAGTVLIVFAAGMLATRLAPRLGLEQSIQLGLFAAAVGSIALLAISILRPTFQPFVTALCIFLFGMGIVNPLGTALALSPFGKAAGAASALLGFWQMVGAAIGVFLTAIISHDALFSLGVVLTVASLLAIGLYTWRARPT